MVSLSEDILFIPGSATITEKGILYLQKLSQLLVKQDAIFIIEGHTDNAYSKPLHFLQLALISR